MKLALLVFPRMPALIAALALLTLAACSTPERRIGRNPEFFASLAPADQELIKKGRVALGFTPDMVKLALGDPDRLLTRTDSSGSSEVWRYTTYESDSGIYLYRGYYHRHYYGSLFPYYLNYPDRLKRDYLKVSFKDGRVWAIEEEK